MPKNPLVLYDMDEDSPPSKRSFLSKNDNIDVPVKDESDATKELNRVRDELFLAMQNQEKMKRKIYELEKNAIQINFEKKAATTEAAIMEMKCEKFEGEKQKDFEKIRREYEALISKERKEKEKILLESSEKERKLISKISKTLIQKLKAETQLENAQNTVTNYQTIIDKVQQQFDEEKTQNEEKHQQEILCFKGSLSAVRNEMQMFKDIELEKQRHQLLNELSGIKREFLHRLEEAQKNQKVERENYQAFKNKIHQKLAAAETLLKQKEEEVEKLKKQIGNLMEENRKQKQKWQKCSGTQCLTNKISHFEGSEQSGSSSTLFYPMSSPLPTPIEICPKWLISMQICNKIFSKCHRNIDTFLQSILPRLFSFAEFLLPVKNLNAEKLDEIQNLISHFWKPIDAAQSKLYFNVLHSVLKRKRDTNRKQIYEACSETSLCGISSSSDDIPFYYSKDIRGFYIPYSDKECTQLLSGGLPQNSNFYIPNKYASSTFIIIVKSDINGKRISRMEIPSGAISITWETKVC